jgi:hypothetical protein
VARRPGRQLARFDDIQRNPVSLVVDAEASRRQLYEIFAG